MIYDILRWIAGICIHWFYRDITVHGFDKIPKSGPVIVAANHNNALVDSLIAGWVIPRRLAMTAKATLTENWLIAMIFRLLNVIPLRRARDEDPLSSATVNRNRNRAAFREIIDHLSHNEAVLIFPEGKSHSEGRVEPLKSGLARMALEAQEKGVKNLRILPVGLVFEDKGTPGSAVQVNFADPIELDTWPDKDAKTLTEAVAARLREAADSHTMTRSNDERSAPHHHHNVLVSVVAAWGKITHEIPIRYARTLAIRKSTSPDEPAMLTMIFGITLVLLMYGVQLAIIGFVAHSILIAGLYLATLVVGAYWAAYHPRRYQST